MNVIAVFTKVSKTSFFGGALLPQKLAVYVTD